MNNYVKFIRGISLEDALAESSLEDNKNSIYFPTDNPSGIVMGGKEYGSATQFQYDQEPTEDSTNLVNSGDLWIEFQRVKKLQQVLEEKLDDLLISSTTVRIETSHSFIDQDIETDVILTVSTSRVVDSLSLYKGGLLKISETDTNQIKTVDKLSETTSYSAVAQIGDKTISSDPFVIPAIKSYIIYTGIRDQNPIENSFSLTEILSGSSTIVSVFPHTIPNIGEGYCKWWAIPADLVITSFKDELGNEDGSYTRATGSFNIGETTYYVYYQYTPILHSTTYNITLNYGTN